MSMCENLKPIYQQVSAVDPAAAPQRADTAVLQL